MTLLALAFVCGVWAVQQLAVLPAPIWVGVLPLLLAIVYFSRAARSSVGQTLRLVAQGVLAFTLGAAWAAGFAQWRLADQLPAAWERRDVELIGVVASMPQLQDHSQRFNFTVEQVLTPDAVIPRHISLAHYEQAFGGRAKNANRPPAVRYHAGQRWHLTVRVKRPHGTMNPHGFDFEAWALERNIRASGYVRERPPGQLLTDAVLEPRYLVEILRERVRARMARVLRDRPYGGVLTALAIGDESGIDTTDWQIFLKTGINHLVSISGLHISMLAGLAFALVHALWRRSERLTIRLPARKAATAAGIVAALLYALIAGFAIPTQRTLYMLAVVALALWTGRRVSMARVLAYALLLVVVFDPWAVLAAGFWLSFGAVAVIAYAVGGRLERPHWLREAVVTQWAVTLGLIPLLLALFQQFSVVSPLANALAIPVVSLLVVPLTLLGSVLPFDWALLLAHWIMQLCMIVMAWLADFSLSVWQQQAPPFWSLPLAVAGVLWMLLPRGFPLRWMGVVALLPMVLVTPSRPADGAMRATVLDVGQGLAVVVTTAHHTLLYDTGPRYSSQSDSGSRIIVPYLRAAGVRALDVLLVSHDDDDHSGGMASVLEQVPVRRFYSALPERHVPPQAVRHQHCQAGQSWQWDGVEFEIVHPTRESYAIDKIKDNDRSCVLRVSSRYGRLLLAGDIERKAERALVASGQALQADVLVAPHHGSKTSSSPLLLQAVAPRAVVFTAGYLSRFGHPHPTVVQRYEALGSRIYRSDRDGALVIDFAATNGIDVTRWRERARRYWHHDFVSEQVPAAASRLPKNPSHAKVATLLEQ